MARAVKDTRQKEQPRGRARLCGRLSPLAVPANRRWGASGGSIFEKSKPFGAVAALLPGGRLHLQHGPIDIVACTEDNACAKAGNCVTFEIWREVRSAIENVVDTITLEEMAKRHQVMHWSGTNEYSI